MSLDVSIFGTAARSARRTAAILFLLSACGGGDGASGPVVPEDPPAPAPAVAPEAVAWLNGRVVPIESSLPDYDPSELEPLRGMVGSARVVALGEATHGTKEFFQMKHRILRFLVREMGFNAFAMEATWPEMNRIDRFVRTGEGDPEVLLSGQYFWTWNTQEVLDMMLWVRDYNRTVAPAEQVRFLGFDMQFPGMGIHNLRTYVEEVDPELLAAVEEGVACLVPFANGPDGRGDSQGYSDQTLAVRNACRTDLDALFELLTERRDALVAASSEEDFEHALQSLRTVIQFEDMRSNRRAGARDYHMARNTLWILDHLGPETKLVIWAHNGHVNDSGLAQGAVLRQELGEGYVVFGFSFWEGEATAVGLNAAGAATGGALPRAIPPPPADSYEANFEAAEARSFFLDLRGVTFDGPATAWLAGPRAFREIGCCLLVQNPGAHVAQMRLPDRFDVTIYFTSSSASQLLPHRLPSTF